MRGSDRSPKGTKPSDSWVNSLATRKSVRKSDSDFRQLIQESPITDQEDVVIAPPRIEVCSEEQWQAAIDQLANLLALAFERRSDDSKAA